MNPNLIWIPAENLFNWVDVGAYWEAFWEAKRRELESLIIESGGHVFPFAAGESRSCVGLFQQSTRGWQ